MPSSRVSAPSRPFACPPSRCDPCLCSCCLADFGSAKVQDTHAGQATTRGGGTEGWQSPEAMVNEGATQASDVFSLGLLLFFVLSEEGGHPFGAASKRTRAMLRFATTDLDDAEEVEEADAKVSKRVAAALGAGEDAELVSAMLRLDPGSRPSAEAVLESATLREHPAAGAQQQEEEEVAECVVCLDSSPTHAVLPCGHRCLCAGCVGAAARECPVCRTPSQGTVRIFE